MTLLLTLTLCSASSLAGPLKPGGSLTKLEFRDQFDHQHNLNDQTRILFFAKSKDAGSLMIDILADVSAEQFRKLHAVYIADISSMPSLVTRLFVLPKMRNIQPPILLVRESDMVAWLPSEADKVTVIKLAGGQVEHISFTADEGTLRAIFDPPPSDGMQKSHDAIQYKHSADNQQR